MLLNQRNSSKYSNAQNNSNSASGLDVQSSQGNIIEMNNYNRARLKLSLTYLMSHGYFKAVRTLIQSRAADLDQTDEWWLLNPHINLINKKCLLARRDRFRMLTRLQTSIDLKDHTHSQQMAIGRTPLMMCSMVEDDAWAFSIAQVLT